MSRLSKNFAVLIVALLSFLSVMGCSPMPVHAQPAWTNLQLTNTAADANPCPITVDQNNTPHIAFTNFNVYYGSNGREFQYNVTYSTLVNSTWVNQVINEYGSALDVAFDNKSNPHVLYENLLGINGRALMYASLEGSSWSISTIDPSGFSSGAGARLVFDSLDNPHVAYTDGGSLKYAEGNGSQWVVQTVKTYQPGAIPYQLSLALNKNNTPYIFYAVFTNIPNGFSYHLMLATFDGFNWATQNITDADSLGNMVLDSNGSPHIVYSSNSTLEYAYWSNNYWKTEPVASTLQGEGYCLALDTYDFPHIVYINSSSIEYASLLGNNWGFQTVAHSLPNSNSNNIAVFLALDSNNNPHVSYSPTNYPAQPIFYATAIEPTIVPPSPTPTMPTPILPVLPIIAVSVTVAVVVISAILIYFKKRKHKPE